MDRLSGAACSRSARWPTQPETCPRHNEGGRSGCGQVSGLRCLDLKCEVHYRTAPVHIPTSSFREKGDVMSYEYHASHDYDDN